jgi:hypothetical protein
LALPRPGSRSARAGCAVAPGALLERAPPAPPLDPRGRGSRQASKCQGQGGKSAWTNTPLRAIAMRGHYGLRAIAMRGHSQEHSFHFVVVCSFFCHWHDVSTAKTCARCCWDGPLGAFLVVPPWPRSAIGDRLLECIHSPLSSTVARALSTNQAWSCTLRLHSKPAQIQGGLDPPRSHELILDSGQSPTAPAYVLSSVVARRGGLFCIAGSH